MIWYLEVSRVMMRSSVNLASASRLSSLCVWYTGSEGTLEAFSPSKKCPSKLTSLCGTHATNQCKHIHNAPRRTSVHALWHHDSLSFQRHTNHHLHVSFLSPSSTVSTQLEFLLLLHNSNHSGRQDNHRLCKIFGSQNADMSYLA